MPSKRCPGSGMRPAENVILDTVLGVDPWGTCSACNRPMRLVFYRLPEHSRGA